MASQNGVEYVYDTRPDAVDAYYDSKVHKEWRFNAAQAQLEREWQEKMWDLQNRYNHPANQKARLTAAGLNPYGDGTIGNVPAGSAGSPNSARSSVDIGQTINGAVGNLVQAVQVFDQTRRTDADVNYKSAGEAKLYREVALLDVQRSYGLMSNEKFMFELNKLFEAYGNRNPYTIDADNKEADTEQKKSISKLNNQLAEESKARIPLIESQAAYNTSLTQTENELREGRVNKQTAEGFLSLLEYNLEKEFGYKTRSMSYEELKQEVQQSRILFPEELKNIRNENALQDLDKELRQMMNEDFEKMTPVERFLLSQGVMFVSDAMSTAAQLKSKR